MTNNSIYISKIKIKTSFTISEMPKARCNKTVYNIMIVYFYIRRKLDILQRPRISSNPADINQFRGHTGKLIPESLLLVSEQNKYGSLCVASRK